MILAINTSESDLIELMLFKGPALVGRVSIREPYKHSELLLATISSFMKKYRCKISELSIMAAVTGPGAFSALRLGLTTVNALAFGLDIPAIELNRSQWQNKDLSKIISHKIKRTEYFKSKLPLSAKYGQEPNITFQKVNKV